MYSLPMSVTLAAFTIASAASTDPISPRVSINPSASLSNACGALQPPLELHHRELRWTRRRLGEGGHPCSCSLGVAASLRRLARAAVLARHRGATLTDCPRCDNCTIIRAHHFISCIHCWIDAPSP